MCISEELHCRNILLHHSNRSLFTTSQWKWHPAVFVTYRLLAAVYALAWQLYIVIVVQYPRDLSHPYVVYLTHWSFFILTCHYVIAAIIAVIHIKDARTLAGLDTTEPLNNYDSVPDFYGSTPSLLGDSTIDHILVDWDPLPWYIKVEWYLYNINTLSCFVVTIVFWSFVFPDMHKSMDSVDFIQHGSNSILVIIELCLCAIPIRILHFIYPFAFFVTYIVFSAIYWGGNNTRVISPLLDWSEPSGAVWGILLGLIGSLIIWMILFTVTKLRKQISRKISHR